MEWSKKIQCTGYGNSGYGCKSLLLVEEEDIYVTTCCRNDYNLCFTFKCPVCGNETDIKDENISSKVKLLAMRKLVNVLRRLK